MLSSAIKYGLFPLHEVLKGHTTIWCHSRLMTSQWLSFAKIKAQQLEDLYSFLKEAKQSVPYYRNLAPKTLDLRDWPVLDKELVRTHIEDLKHPKARHLKLKSTGGSTGHPLHFYVGQERISHDVASFRRARRWWGVDVGDKEFVIWGAPEETKTQSTLKKFRDFLLRSQMVSARGLNREKALLLLKDIARKKPKVLFSYPSILAYLAESAILAEKSIESSVKVAFVTSELLEPFQKKLIEEVFKCQVANGYGGRESGFIAHACPYGSLHISAEGIVVEILDENNLPVPEGTLGEIVITHLRTLDFPFIRYKTGDRGALSNKPCACGRGLPVLTELQGRQSDLIYTHDKTLVHRAHIFQVISQFQEIKHFKFIQHEANEYELLLSLEDLPDAKKIELEQAFKNLLGNNCILNITLKDILPQEESGKHRFIINRMKDYRAREDVA